MDNKRSEDAGSIEVFGGGFDVEVEVRRESDKGVDEGGDSFVVKGITEECMKVIRPDVEGFTVYAGNLDSNAKQALVGADFFEVSISGVKPDGNDFISQCVVVNPKISPEATASDINQKVLMIIQEACELARLWGSDSPENRSNPFKQISVKPVYRRLEK